MIRSTTGSQPPIRTIQPAPPDKGGWLRRLLPFLAAHKVNVGIAFGVSIGGMIVTALTPVIEKVVIDDVIIHHTRSLAPWLAALIFAGAIGFVSAYIRRFVGGRVALDVQYDLRNAIYERLQRLDFASHDELQTGQLVSRASSDVALLQGLLGFLPLMTGNLIMVVGLSLTMRGFIVSNHFDMMPDFMRDMATWIKAGKMTWRETIADG